MKTTFYVSRRTFKKVFFVSFLLFSLLLDYEQRQIGILIKKTATHGEFALYVFRRTKWGKTNWKTSFSQFSVRLFWNYSLGALKLHFTCPEDLSQGNCSLKKKLPEKDFKSWAKSSQNFCKLFPTRLSKLLFRCQGGLFYKTRCFDKNSLYDIFS